MVLWGELIIHGLWHVFQYVRLSFCSLGSQLEREGSVVGWFYFDFLHHPPSSPKPAIWIKDKWDWQHLNEDKWCSDTHPQMKVKSHVGVVWRIHCITLAFYNWWLTVEDKSSMRNVPAATHHTAFILSCWANSVGTEMTEWLGCRPEMYFNWKNNKAFIAGESYTSFYS